MKFSLSYCNKNFRYSQRGKNSGFSEVKALEVLNEYDVQYLYIPKDVDKLDYVKDGKCFRRRKEGLYKVLC